MELNIYQKKIQKEHPDFKIALGDEIYLVEKREKKIKYYHFILIAKNATGHKALRELSSRAWMNSYWDRDIERVPTLYDELTEIVNKYPNSLIATTACLGGELSQSILALTAAEKANNADAVAAAHNHIVSFIQYCQNLFGDDFYIECAPGQSKEQVIVNKRLKSIASCFNIKMVIGTDAHYLTTEDRYAHEAYLNSKDGEREVASFYQYAYLQNQEEIFNNLAPSFDESFIKEMFSNSIEIYDKIENYDLTHKQQVPKVDVIDYPKKDDLKEYPLLHSMYQSDDKVNRYWVNQCIDKLKEKGLYNKEYLDRLEEEADIKQTISEKLETNMFMYPVTLQHYIDLMWDCGSTIGAGRGSSCSGLNHYLLGVTQLDPLKWKLPFWRYLNKDRVELGDIDLDLSPSKRPAIIRAIKRERASRFNNEIDEQSRKNLGCTLIATFGTEGTRSTILTACRGYRSKEFPTGIDSDAAQYLSSLVPAERGFNWSLHDLIYGDKEKGRAPVTLFVNEVNKYEGLLDIMLKIEGIINKRSSHASGVMLFDDDPYEYCAFMKTPNGEIITQYDLHMVEAAGGVKFDFLVTENQDKIIQTLKVLQQEGKIESDLTIRQLYDKYLHPDVLDIKDEKVWAAINSGSIISLFQFDSEVGSQAIKKIQPHNILELSDSNGLK